MPELPFSGGSIVPQRRRTRRHVLPSTQPTLAQSVRDGGLSQLVLAIPGLYVLGAVALVVVTLAIDAALGDSVPLLPRFGGQNARSMLSVLAGAFVTVTALVYWVRILAVQFSADEFSSRMLRYFLDDRVQQHTLGALLGGLTYVLVVLQAVPDRGAGLATVPHLSVGLSMLVAVGAAATIVFSIYSGARQTQIGRLVRWVTDEVVEYIQRAHPERGSPAQDPAQHPAEDPPEGAYREVRAVDSGWVQQINEGRLLGSLPPGTTAQLQIRTGVFVVQGTVLARLWLKQDGAVGQDVAAAVRLGSDPTMEQDVAYGIRQLVDIAERSLSPSVGDSTTAYEVIVHLGLVLRELLLRDLPATILEDDEGRKLLRPREYSLFDYVDLALVRIRVADTGMPGTSAALLETIGMLVRELEEADLSDRADYLRQHAALILEGIERQDLLEWDKREVRQEAARQALLPTSEPQPV